MMWRQHRKKSAMVSRKLVQRKTCLRYEEEGLEMYKLSANNLLEERSVGWIALFVSWVSLGILQDRAPSLGVALRDLMSLPDRAPLQVGPSWAILSRSSEGPAWSFLSRAPFANISSSASSLCFTRLDRSRGGISGVRWTPELYLNRRANLRAAFAICNTKTIIHLPTSPHKRQAPSSNKHL